MSAPVVVSIDIAAPPGSVVALVSDVTRTGEWSPETVSCAWRGGASGPAVGARFAGANRRGRHRWTTRCTVTAADGATFAFDVAYRGMAVASWSYAATLAPGGGATVTETVVDRRGRVMQLVGRLGTGVADRAAHNRAGMERTLAALAAAAER